MFAVPPQKPSEVEHHHNVPMPHRMVLQRQLLARTAVVLLILLIAVAIIIVISGRRMNLDAPQATLKTLQEARSAGNLDAMVACMTPETRAAMRAWLDPAIALKSKLESVRKTVASRFGQEIADKSFWNWDQWSLPTGTAAAIVKTDWSAIPIDVQGDTAIVRLSDSANECLRLVRIDQKWYVTAGSAASIQMMATHRKALLQEMVMVLEMFENKINTGQVSKDNFDEQFLICMMNIMGDPRQ
jgi:hypothetical protein